MLLDVITPDAKIFSGEVTAVQLPGIDGSFQLLNNHAPIISALKEGQIKIDLSQDFNTEDEKPHQSISIENNKTIRVAIKGGVIEMLNNKIIVLAE